MGSFFCIPMIASSPAGLASPYSPYSIIFSVIPYLKDAAALSAMKEQGRARFEVMAVASMKL